MYKIIFFFILSFSVTSFAKSKEEKELQVQEDIQELQATRRWENLPKGTLTTKLGIATPSLQLDIQEKDGLASRLKYSPNVGGKVFTSLSYGGLSASISGKAGKSEDESKYGTSKNIDFQFRFYGTKWSPEVFYQRYSGYYLENSEAADTTYNDSMPRYQRPDISMTYLGGNLIYNFSEEKFSLGSTFDYGRRQTESGGALLGMSSLTRHEIKAESSFVPPSQQANYSEFSLLRKAEIHNAAIGLGYGYNLIMGRVNVGAVVGVAASYQKQYLTYVSKLENLTTVDLKTYFKVGLGYNGDSFISGVNFNIDNGNSELANAKVAYNTMQFLVFVGYRFHDMQWNWFDNLINKYWPLSSSEI